MPFQAKCWKILAHCNRTCLEAVRAASGRGNPTTADWCRPFRHQDPSAYGRGPATYVQAPPVLKVVGTACSGFPTPGLGSRSFSAAGAHRGPSRGLSDCASTSHQNKTVSRMVAIIRSSKSSTMCRAMNSRSWLQILSRRIGITSNGRKLSSSNLM